MQQLSFQSGILESVPQFAKFITYQLTDPHNLAQCLTRLAARVDGQGVVMGIGVKLAMALGKNIPSLENMPHYQQGHLDLPANQHDLFLWLRADDDSASIGELAHRALALDELLLKNFTQKEHKDAFKYSGRDLTGYEDGTENPEGDKAIEAAFVTHGPAGIVGSSYVAFQPWLHDIAVFKKHSQQQQDDIIGRRLSDNEEFAEAPASAHVKRAAQESFSPEAFMLRRSMPWVSGPNNGLVFVAFGKDFTAYDAIMRRMIGADDGLVDGLFSFSQPQGGGFYWCPPVVAGQIDLQALL